MKKSVAIVFVAACAWLPIVPAAAITNVDRSVKKADAGAAVPLEQVRKHCKSKQSACHALRHNF